MNNKSDLLTQLRIDRDDDPEPRARWPWVAAACILAALLAALLWSWLAPGALAVTTQSARVVSSSGGSASVLDATGYVTARRYSTVSSKVTARVLEVLVEEGTSVEQGQVVARLDDSDTRRNLAVEQAGLSVARARVEETRARLYEAERVHKRVAEMFRRELVSEAELDAANSNFLSLQAELKARQAEVLSAQRRVELHEQYLDDLVLRAPFSGVVISKDAQPGEVISPVSAGGGFTRTGICSLVDMSSLEIEVDVNESYIDRVFSGQPVEATLEAYPDWAIPAHVIAIVPAADRQKATVRVRVGFSELDPRILPDMGIKVRFLEATPSGEADGESRQGIAVPVSAVQPRGGKTDVFVVRDGVARRRAVEVEKRNAGEYWITQGLSPGEIYVVDPPPTLEDNAAVTVD